MREKLILRHSATVFTASVLARPGTPSSKMWPPVSRPISSRSTMTSWPTTRFATSRVMVCVSTASFVFAVRVVISETLPLPASRSAPYLERRVPATPSPPCDPIAPTLRSPRRARTACVAVFHPARRTSPTPPARSEEHTSELQSPYDLVCRLLLEKKKQKHDKIHHRSP